MGVKKSIQQAAQTAVLFAFFAVLTTVIFAPSTQAQAAPVDPVEPPVFVLPEVCTATPPIEPVEPTEPVDTATLAPSGEEEVPAEVDPAAPVAGIAITPTAPTNLSPITWVWATTLPADTPPVLAGYEYAIYRDDVFETQGSLLADATSFSYAPAADGTFTFYLWAVEQGTGDALYCANTATPLNATAPVIVGDGYTQNGNVATPNLTIDETDVVFSWAVTGGPAGGATISDPTALTPQFTFTADGTYEFTLTVTDSLGNITTLILSITYLVPFIPGPTSPLIPEEVVPKPVTPYVRPASVTTTPATSEYPTASDPQEIDAEVLASLNNSAENQGDAEITSTATAVTRSEQGWKLFGLAWYWWVLIAAILVSGWLWTVRTYRAAGRPDDL